MCARCVKFKPPKMKRYPIAWVWQLEDGALCFWAEPTRKALVDSGKPSPGAKPICVRLVPNVEYRKFADKV